MTLEEHSRIFEEHSVCITEARLERPGPLILYVNEEFESLTGYTSAEVVGKLSPRILQGPKTDRGVLDRLKDCCTRGQYFEGATTNYRKNRTPFNMIWNINPIIVRGKIVAYLSLQQGDEFARTIAILEKIRAKQSDINDSIEDLFAKLVDDNKS